MGRKPRLVNCVPGAGASCRRLHTIGELRRTRTSMRKAAFLLAAFLTISSGAAAQELRIGFVNTTTGGGAVIGRDMENGWKLGLEHQGWMRDGDKLGGVPTRIFYVDDQQK